MTSAILICHDCSKTLRVIDDGEDKVELEALMSWTRIHQGENLGVEVED